MSSSQQARLDTLRTSWKHIAHHQAYIDHRLLRVEIVLGVAPRFGAGRRRGVRTNRCDAFELDVAE